MWDRAGALPSEQMICELFWRVRGARPVYAAPWRSRRERRAGRFSSSEATAPKTKLVAVLRSWLEDDPTGAEGVYSDFLGD